MLKQEGRATVITLNEIASWTLGADPVIEERRLDLEGRLCRIRREIRDQRVSFWNDVQALKRELRDIKDLYGAVRGAEQAIADTSSKKEKRKQKQ